MHAFDARLGQLLDAAGALPAGRRQRLARTLRQDDVELAMPLDDAVLGPAMKAALRVAAHEVLDTFCLHLESGLARCGSAEKQSLVLAIVALALVDRACVTLQVDGREVGLEFTADERFVIDPAGDGQFIDIDRKSAGVVTRCRVAISEREPADLRFSSNALASDPFQCAAEVLQALRNNPQMTQMLAVEEG